MKKPAGLRTTACFFADKEFEASTVSHITNEWHISDPLSYCFFEGKEYLSSRILKKGSDPSVWYGNPGKSTKKRKESD